MLPKLHTHPQFSVLPAPGTSPVERLHQSLETHIARQRETLAALRQLHGDMSDAVARLLLELSIDGKERQLALLRRLEASLRDGIAWSHSPNALPEDHHCTQDAAVLRSAEGCLQLELESQRSSSELAVAYQAAGGSPLEPLLLRTLAQECAVRKDLLQAVVSRLTRRPSAEPLLGSPVTRNHIVIRRLAAVAVETQPPE